MIGWTCIPAYPCYILTSASDPARHGAPWAVAQCLSVAMRGLRRGAALPVPCGDVTPGVEAAHQTAQLRRALLRHGGMAPWALHSWAALVGASSDPWALACLRTIHSARKQARIEAILPPILRMRGIVSPPYGGIFPAYSISDTLSVSPAFRHDLRRGQAADIFCSR